MMMMMMLQGKMIKMLYIFLINQKLVYSLSRVLLFCYRMDCQTFLSMGFPRQEYWSGLPFPSPGGLPDPGIEIVSPTLQVDSLLLGYQGSPNQKFKSQ